MSETKICPYCGEEIKAEAKKCRYCGEWFVPKDNPVPTADTTATTEAVPDDVENIEFKIERKAEKSAEEYLKTMSLPSEVQTLCDEGRFWKAISVLETKQGKMLEGEYMCVLAHIYMLKMLNSGSYDDYQRVDGLLNEAARSGGQRTSVSNCRQALKKIYHDHLMPPEERENEDIALAMNTDKRFIEKYNYYSTFAKRFNFLNNGKDMIASADPRAAANPHWAEVRAKHELGKSDIPLFVRYRSSTDTFAITSRGVSHYNKDKGFELQKLSWKDIERVEHTNGQIVFFTSDENYTANNLKVDEYDAVKFSDDATINRFIETFMSVLEELKPKKVEKKPTLNLAETTVANAVRPGQTVETLHVAEPQVVPQVSIQQPTMVTPQPFIPMQEQNISEEDTKRCLTRYGLGSLMENENLKPLIPIIVDMAKMDEMMDDFVEQASKVDEAIQEFKGEIYDAACDIFNESTKIKNRKMQNVGMAAAGVVAIGGLAYAKWQEWKNEQRQADREEAMMEMKQKMARVKDPNIVALHEMIVKRLPQLQKLYDKELSKSYLPTDDKLEKKVYAFKLTFFLYGKMLYMADLSDYFHKMFAKWKELESLDDMPPLQNDTLARLVEKWDNEKTISLMHESSPTGQWPVYSLLTLSDPFIMQNGIGEQLIEDIGNKTEYSSVAAKALGDNEYYNYICGMYEKKPWSTAKYYIVAILTTIIGVLLGWVIIGLLIEKIFSTDISDTWIPTILFFVVCWIAYKAFKSCKIEYIKEKEDWGINIAKRVDFKLNNDKK